MPLLTTSDFLGILPSELLDDIWDGLDAPSDLLSLSLTSKDAMKIIIPNHLHYRHLRCDIRRTDLWRALIVDKRKARRFRRLEIVSENHGSGETALIPTALDFSTDEESMKVFGDSKSMPGNHDSYFSLLETVIRHMPRLMVFRWRGVLRPTTGILAVILGTYSVNELQLRLDLPRTWDPIPVIDLPKESCSFPTSLKRIILRESTHMSEFDEYTPMVPRKKLFSDILLSSPLLEYLDLCSYPSHDFSDIFDSNSWPHLRQLSIDEISIQSQSAYDRFFEAHQQLEQLSLRGIGYPTTHIANLPNLRSFDARWPSREVEERLSEGILERLTHLGLYSASYDNAAVSPMRRLLLKAARLQRLEIKNIVYDQESLMDFIACIPQVEMLKLDWVYPKNTALLLQKEAQPLFGLLRLLPKLTHFGSVHEAFWTPQADASAADKEIIPYSAALQSLCASSSTLKHVEFFLLRDGIGERKLSSSWLTIQRSVDGKYAGYVLRRDVDFRNGDQ